MRPFSTPFCKQTKVGIIATFILVDTTSQSSPSMSNVTNVHREYLDANETYAGCMALHGLHQSAVNFTNKVEPSCAANNSSHR